MDRVIRIIQNNQFYEKLLLDIQNNSSKYCIFLDIDGTISEFSTDPEKSFIPPQVLDNIQKFINLNIPVFAVTGRSAATAYLLFNPIEIPIASTHGLEISENSKVSIQSYLPNPQFAQLKREIEQKCSVYPDLLIEYKTHSIALHYRNNPNLQEVARIIVLELLEKYSFMKLSKGKFVWELVPIEADKGTAIRSLMNNYELHDYRPIFIGDDITDETGFIVVNQANGISIKVGAGATQAQYHLENVGAVIQFLADLQNRLEQKKLHKSIQYKDKYYV